MNAYAGLLRCALLLLVATSCTAPTQSGKVNHYRIAVLLDPPRGFIEASVDLTLRSPTAGVEALTFQLHRQLQVEAVRGALVADYESDIDGAAAILWMPEARSLHVDLTRTLERGERVDLHFEYQGTVDAWPQWSANVITEDWTELGLYFPWFPYNYEEYGPFTFEVDVAIAPEYVVRGFGEAKRTNLTWHLEWNQPTNDIVLVASRDLRSARVREGDHTVQVHFTSLHDSTAKRVGQEVISMLQTYSSWFGKAGQENLNLVESKRAHGGGYTRPGLIVLGQLSLVMEPDERANYIRYLAHEAAHLWWNQAAPESWEDWLNESFAEYSALLVLRDQLGDTEFRSWLDNKRDAAEGTISVWGMARSDLSTEEEVREVNSVLYSKGPVLLNELVERIGLDGFLKWCRELARHDVSSTEAALELLSSLEGNNTSQWFRDLLQAH